MIWVQHMTNHHNTERCIFPCLSSNCPETKALYPCKVGLRFWQQRLFSSPTRGDNAKLPCKTMIRHCRCSTLKYGATEIQNSFVTNRWSLKPPHVLSPRTGEAAALEKTFMPLTKLPMSTKKRHSSLLRVGHRRPSATEGITATRHAWASPADTHQPYELRYRR